MSSNHSTSQEIFSVDSSDMDTSSPSSSPKLSARPLADATEEHPLYHFHDGSLEFELEGVKYRVHSSLFARHCGFASTWAQDLRDPGAARISRADMDAFLYMIYLATYQYPDLNLSAEKWTSVLRLAARWKSDGMRALAIQMLAGDLPPFEKLLLCRKYDVLGWLAPACAALALRPAPLTMVEAEQLEKADIVRVFLAREAVSKGGLAATEEAISAWIDGFLSKSESSFHRETASAPVAQPSFETTPTHVEPTVSSPSTSPLKPTPERVAEASESEDRGRAEASTSFSSQNDTVHPVSQGATPGHIDAQLPEKASYASIAEAASVRPALNANASPFQTQSHATSSNLQEGGPSSEASLVSSQTATAPIAPVRSLEEMTTDAVDSIRAQRYDQAFDSLTLDNLKIIASQVAPSLVVHPPQRLGAPDVQRLQHLIRAIMRHVFANSGYLQRGAQFIAALSTRPSLKNVRFEIVFHDDMQSLSSRWATFRSRGQPAVDLGGLMVDLSTNTRKVYQDQMCLGRGFFRTLVRLGVLPATNKYVEMLVQTHPSRANP